MRPSPRSRGERSLLGSRLSPDSVIRGFRRDADVVGVRFATTGARDADEPRLAAQIVDRRGARVAHARAKTTDELVHERRERTEGANATLDPFGNELRELANVGLAVAIAGAARFHRAERAHPAVRLERTILG